MKNKPEILAKGIALEDWNHDVYCKECYTKSRVNHTHVWIESGYYNYYVSCPTCDSEIYIEGANIPISIRRIADENLKIKKAIDSKNFWEKFWQWVCFLGVVSCCVVASYGCVLHLRHNRQNAVVFTSGIQAEK